MIEALLGAGLTAPQVRDAYAAAGKGHLPVGTIYALRSHLALPLVNPGHVELIPWKVLTRERAAAFPAQMLRFESRHRRGEVLHPLDETKRQRFLRFLDRQGVVVDYAPEEIVQRKGWRYVQRRQGIDGDIIRNPFMADDGHLIPRPGGL